MKEQEFLDEGAGREEDSSSVRGRTEDKTRLNTNVDGTVNTTKTNTTKKVKKDESDEYSLSSDEELQ